MGGYTFSFITYFYFLWLQKERQTDIGIGKNT